jgi:hemerythrin-like metal-binding protein
MPFINWSDELSTKVKVFDDQHKKLLGLVNDLYANMAQGKGKEVMQKTLSGLVDYTRTHFASEEEMMTRHKYLGYLSHKAEHDRLTKQAADLLQKLQAGEPVMSVHVMRFLKDWLEQHIMKIDKQYGPFLNAKGVA